MKIGISAKLFIAVVTTAVLAIAIMAIALRHNFRHGFLDYINTTEINRLANVSDRVLAVYREQGGWDFIRQNPRAGRRLLRGIIHDLRQSPGHHAMHEPHMGDNGELPLFNRISLLDESKHLLAGARELGQFAKLVPVKSVDGQIIAWLGYNPATGLSDTVDIQFQQSQVNTSIVISLLALLIAAIIAMLLSRQFLMPIKQLVAATRKLGDGELETRVRVESNDEIGRLADDFNQLAESLMQQERARHQWLADIAHELRTPVAVLRGEIEALQDGIRKPTTQSLSSLHDEVMRLNGLIEDLYQLSLSDIGALNYHKSQLHLNGLLRSIIDAFEQQYQQKSIRVSQTIDDCEQVYLHADEQRIRQVFANLFQNSIRYTDNNGQINIRCECDSQNATIHWIDSTPGVSDEALPKLFDRLYRVDPSRDRKSGGAGLGLSICKNIVSAHDGSIEAQHSELGGLHLIIKLPLSEGPPLSEHLLAHTK